MVDVDELLCVMARGIGLARSFIPIECVYSSPGKMVVKQEGDEYIEGGILPFEKRAISEGMVPNKNAFWRFFTTNRCSINNVSAAMALKEFVSRLLSEGRQVTFRGHDVSSENQIAVMNMTWYHKYVPLEIHWSSKGTITRTTHRHTVLAIEVEQNVYYTVDYASAQYGVYDYTTEGYNMSVRNEWVFEPDVYDVEKWVELAEKEGSKSTSWLEQMSVRITDELVENHVSRLNETN